MNTKKYLKYSILPLALMLGGLAFTACTDDIEGGKPVDEGIRRREARRRHVARRDVEQERVGDRTALGQTPDRGLLPPYESAAEGCRREDRDGSRLSETYNAEHGTEFELFPAANVAIDREGKLLLAPDEIRSVGVGVTLAAGSELQEGTTYLLPLKATSSTEGITLSERRSMRSIW